MFVVLRNSWQTNDLFRDPLFLLLYCPLQVWGVGVLRSWPVLKLIAKLPFDISLLPLNNIQAL